MYPLNKLIKKIQDLKVEVTGVFGEYKYLDANFKYLSPLYDSTLVPDRIKYQVESTMTITETLTYLKKHKDNISRVIILLKPDTYQLFIWHRDGFILAVNMVM